jgi:pimeloyl-ACP methyl ester carboxylesterase
VTRYAFSVDVLRDETGQGVRERVGTIVGSAGPVPLAIWTPESGETRRLVLVGHGASGTKEEGYVVALARGLARHQECAVVAIDGPVHGARSGSDDGGSFLQFAQRWSSDETLTDRMVTDWRETIDFVTSDGIVEQAVPIGYWGLSMGTIFGLPLVAAESRIRAAVLGLMGTTGPSRQRLINDAPRVTVPTLFLLQWDDELIAREQGFELFGLLGSTDKTLIASPGAHAAVPTETFHRTAGFLADRLDHVVASSK